MNINSRKEIFIEKARKTHGEAYDYSKVDYVNSTTKVCIICPKHGEFWQAPSEHIRGKKCPKCANHYRGVRSNKDEFVSRARAVHGDRYDYSKVEYINAETKVCIICPEHGEFYMRPMNHLLGQGCPKCAGKNLSREEIIDRFRKVHGDRYDYSKVEKVKFKEKVCIICPEHGEFWQSIGKHLIGRNCPKCAKISASAKLNKDTEDFIRRATLVWGDKYDYSKVNYIKAQERVEIICKKHGSFFQRAYDHLNGHGCPICGQLQSKSENDIYEHVCERVGEGGVIHNDRSVLNGKEIDILIPSMGIGIEFDGLRWHSEEFGSGKFYHLDKTNLAKEKGIRLIHIFEDEWAHHGELVLDKIDHILGVNDDKARISARECSVHEINKHEARGFLDKNHIQGYTPSTVYLGCFKGEDLIGVMTFLKNGLDMWTLNRFATDIRYVCRGVGGKLLSYFERNYDYKEIKSFADRRWCDDGNNIYVKLGFTKECDIRPDYRYVLLSDPHVRIHKFNFRKKLLVKRFGLDNSLTESEMADKLGYGKVWDCGLIKYVKKR